MLTFFHNVPDFELPREEASKSPNSRELANYEDYARRELPRLVRSNIEEVIRREMQHVEVSLISSLVQIIQDCQDMMFRSYRETQDNSDEVHIPPSIDHETSTSSKLPDNDEEPNSRSLQQSSQAQTSFPGAIFGPPAPHHADPILPTIVVNNPERSLPGLPSDAILFDSEYFSEQQQICGCFDPCNCGTYTLHGQESEDNAMEKIVDEDIAWNEWSTYLHWNQVDSSMESDFNLRNGK